MSLTDKEKILIARQIRKELPEIEYRKDRSVVRIYQLDDLIKLVYTIYNRGVKVGRERANIMLKKELKKAINKVL